MILAAVHGRKLFDEKGENVALVFGACCPGGVFVQSAEKTSLAGEWVTSFRTKTDQRCLSKRTRSVYLFGDGRDVHHDETRGKSRVSEFQFFLADRVTNELLNLFRSVDRANRLFGVRFDPGSSAVLFGP